MSDMLAHIIVPVASENDAIETARALEAYDADVGEITLVYVVEKAGGGVDKAGVKQREEAAQEAFDAFEGILSSVTVHEQIAYDTDVVDGILAVADDTHATAIVFVPREGGRFIRLLTGDVALRLITEADLPVITLPRPTDT